MQVSNLFVDRTWDRSHIWLLDIRAKPRLMYCSWYWFVCFIVPFSPFPRVGETRALLYRALSPRYRLLKSRRGRTRCSHSSRKFLHTFIVPIVSRTLLLRAALYLRTQISGSPEYSTRGSIGRMHILDPSCLSSWCICWNSVSLPRPYAQCEKAYSETGY